MKRNGFIWIWLTGVLFTFQVYAQELTKIPGKFHAVRFFGGVRPLFMSFHDKTGMDAQMYNISMDAGLSGIREGRFISWHIGAGLMIVDLAGHSHRLRHVSYDRETARKELEIPDYYDKIDYLYVSDLLSFRKLGLSISGGLKFYLAEYSYIWPNFYAGCSGYFFVFPAREEKYYEVYAIRSQTFERKEYYQSLTHRLTKNILVPGIEVGCEFPGAKSRMTDCGLKGGYGVHKTYFVSLFAHLKL